MKLSKLENTPLNNWFLSLDISMSRKVSLFLVSFSEVNLILL